MPHTVPGEEADPEADDDAEDDGELLQRDERPAYLRGTDLGDVEWREHAEGADAYAAHRAANE